MALSSGSCYSISTQFSKIPTYSVSINNPRNAFLWLTSSSNSDDSSKPSFSVSAGLSSAPKARFVARRTESISVRPLERPLRFYVCVC
ncbi:hypothetical protein HanLR1_Chr14g0548751 [Helianthus annuus]|nr:hypothetical protein HanLR1_Chr14g0548751 [Helianthus annuus]